MTKRSHTALSKAHTIETNIALGRQYHGRGELAAAEKCYRQVLALEPDHADALHMLGVVALQAKHFEDAVKLIKRAAQLNRRDPGIYANLGLAYRRINSDEKAIEAYETALSIDPNFETALFNLGKLYLDTLQFEKAVPLYTRCVELNPSDADAYVNLGNAHKFSGDRDKAMVAYERALRLAPNLGHAYGNIAAVLLDRGWHSAALAVMDKAVALAPQPGELRFKRSLMALRSGQLATGWADYDSRFFAETERIARWEEPPPFWAGEDLAGKSIIVRTEQGLGDEILYASIVPEVLARASRCAIECSPRMVPVFARSFPGAEVQRYKGQGVSLTPLEGFDYQISIGSLGRFFRARFDLFPRHQGYMKADPGHVARLRARYQAIKPGNKIVGLSWRSKSERVGNSKSSRLEDWTDILTVPGITFVNLQYGDCADEIAAARNKFGIDIIEDAEVNSLASMDDFFAQVAAMDLVVSTSNTTVHVAGSQNVPVWVMVAIGPASLWYWFLDRTDSPWYPSLRFFRQPPLDGDNEAARWNDAVKLIGKDLRAWINEASAAAHKGHS